MSVLRSSIVFGVLFTCICAQKPFYASSSNQYPSVLPQNLPNNPDVGNRIGENSTPDPFLGSEKQPVYNVEKELVDRITNQYPRDKQPFWYVNAAQLNSIRYQQQPGAQPVEQPVEQPAVQQAVQPAIQPAVQPAAQRVVQPAAQRVVQRPGQPAVQPINEFSPTRRQQVTNQQQQRNF